MIFQSTLPARGATCGTLAFIIGAAIFQSTLPARGATKDGVAYSTPIFISIHAPCTGSDTPMTSVTPFGWRFQSTLPARGATVSRIASSAFSRISIHAPCTGSDRGYLETRRPRRISIHAPCTGSDIMAYNAIIDHKNFNPRSLHGERRSFFRTISSSALFQSTLPARGATKAQGDISDAQTISIHAPCTGSDSAI